MLFTRSLNSITSTLNQASDITKIETYLSSGDVLFSDLITKPEFLLGDGTLDAGQAIIRVTADVTGQPLSQDHYVIVISDNQEVIDVTGDKKVGIKIDQTFVDNATSVTSNLGLGVAQIFSEATWPTEPHIKLWEITAGDWAGATDLRSGLVLDGTKIDLSNYGGDILADNITANNIDVTNLDADTIILDGDDLGDTIDNLTNNFKVMSIVKEAGEDIQQGMIVRYDIGNDMVYETYADASEPQGQLVGVATENYLTGEMAKIDIVGVTEVYTGLSQGMDYYLAESGFFDDSTGGIQITQNNIQRGTGYVSGNSIVFDGSGFTGISYNFFNLLFPQGDPSDISRTAFDFVWNFWIKTTDANSRVYHISLEKTTPGNDITEMFLDITAAGLIRLGGFGSSGQDLINNPSGYIESITQINDGSWHMIQARYLSTVATWEIYVDNVLEDSGANTDGIVTYEMNSAIPFIDPYESIGDGHIGRDGTDYSGFPFTGEIDSFSLSARTTGLQPDPKLIDFWNAGVGLPYTPSEFFTYYLAFDLTKPNITTNNRSGIFVGNAWSDTQFKLRIPSNNKNVRAEFQEIERTASEASPLFTYDNPSFLVYEYVEDSLLTFAKGGRFQLNIRFTLENNGGVGQVTQCQLRKVDSLTPIPANGEVGDVLGVYTCNPVGGNDYQHVTETRVIDALEGDKLFFRIQGGEISSRYYQILPIRDY